MTSVEVFREVLVVLLASIVSGVGAAFATGKRVNDSNLALERRVMRLEQWAWGANNTNGLDGDVKEIRRSFFAFVSRSDRHEALQERRNFRQHPHDGMRDDDA